MGKGYNNYMCKKPFHPGSKSNIKRAWMAEQRLDNDKKKQDELRTQYEKEQELYNNKALISSESKDKLALNFMYEAPPGAKREHQREDDEPEYKFEWQRKYNAPREDFAKDNKEIRDQPFGIPVRNVRCIKCHQWGHLNTDRECPLFNQASKNGTSASSIDPLELMRQMRDDGLQLKKDLIGHQFAAECANQQMLSDGEEEDPEMEFLKTLSTKQKKKLLRKLNKLATKQNQETSENSQAKKKKKKSKKKKENKRKKEKPEKRNDSDAHGSRKRKRRDSSSESSSSNDSSSSSSESDTKRKHRKIHHDDYKKKKR